MMRAADGNLDKQSIGISGHLGRCWDWLNLHARVVLGVYAVLLVLGTHWPNLKFFPPPEDPHPLDNILKLDKVWHVMGFGGLMVLLILAEVGGRGRPWVRRCGAALAVGVVFSIVDETTQGLMPGRQMSVSDLVTNLLVVLGVYLVALLPAEREPTRPPRVLWWALGISVPVLTVLALSPAVMDQAVEWKRSIVEGSVTNLHPFDHIAHGVLSAALSVMVFVIWPMASRRPRRAALAALLLVNLAGPGLEVVQHFTGRGVQWQDELAHAIGVLLAMMWWAARLSWSPRLREPATPPSPAAAPGMSPPA